MATKRIRKNRYRRKQNKPPAHSLIGAVRLLAAGAGVLMLSILFIFCHDVITQWQAFAVQKIALTGNQRLSREEICERSQIQTGVNIFSVNLTVARHNLRAHPWVAEAHIQREIPDGIRVHIREHRAVAVIDLGRKFLMDDAGTIFKELEPDDPANIPIVQGLRYADVVVDVDASRARKQNGRTAEVPGGQKSYAAPLESLLTVLKLGSDTDSVLPNRLVDRIEIDRETGITVHLAEKPKTVKLGYGEYSEKYAVLQRLLNYLQKGDALEWRGIEAVDLINLRRIVVQPLFDIGTGMGQPNDSGARNNKVS